MQNAAQIEFWNGDTGQNWVTHDALMETMLSPLGERVLDSLPVIPGAHALDIGCGCGHPTLSLARRIGPNGSVVGIDISQPMLAVAKTLADKAPSKSAPVTFIKADAQTHRFSGKAFDLVFSRFGVMFFEDPVAAFRNIRSAMRPDGRLAFCCWQPRTVNPFMTVPAMAAMELLPPPPEMPPRAPGPFAFEDAGYVDSILSEAGFTTIDITPVSQPLIFGKGLSAEEIIDRLVQIGPIAQMVREAPDALRQPVLAKVKTAISPYYSEASGMTLEGNFWQVNAAA
jgi:SAM-dependent methyltransferase